MFTDMWILRDPHMDIVVDLTQVENFIEILYFFIRHSNLFFGDSLWVTGWKLDNFLFFLQISLMVISGFWGKSTLKLESHKVG